MIEIEIICNACSFNNVILERKLEATINCQNCGEILLKLQEIKGWIYVLSNPSMPGLLKIGYTEREVEERIKELDSETGVPSPFILEAYCTSKNPRDDESRIHKSLSIYRMESKEFFKVDFDIAIETIGKILEKSPQLSKERMMDREKIKRQKEEESKRKQLEEKAKEEKTEEESSRKQLVEEINKRERKERERIKRFLKKNYEGK